MSRGILDGKGHTPMNGRARVPLTLRVGPVRINVSYWEGDGDCSLMFLHGLGEGAYVWDGLVQRVRGRNATLAVDMRGHGDSGWAADGDYSLDAHAGDVVHIVEHLDLTRVVLVAHSIGAAVAVRALRRLDSRLAALCIIDMGPPGARSGHATVVSELESAPESFSSRGECLAYLTATRPFGDPAILAAYVEQATEPGPGGELRWKRDPRVTSCSASAVEFDVLREAQCPVLIVRGAASSILSSSQAERLAALPRRGRLETVAAAGHAIMSENPDGLAEILRRFLHENQRS